MPGIYVLFIVHSSHRGESRGGARRSDSCIWQYPTSSLMAGLKCKIRITHVYIWTHIRVMREHTQTHTRAHTQTHTHAHARKHTHTHRKRHIHADRHRGIQTHTHTPQIQIHTLAVRAPMHSRMRTHTLTHKTQQKHTQPYKHTRARTHIRTHTNTHTDKCKMNTYVSS